MPKTGVLFPGQGAQAVGMGRDVYEKSAAARAVFDLADSVLPFKLSDVVFSGPEDRLTETDVSQPAILVASIAVAEAAREAGWKTDSAATAGLSLGEYSALAFSGALQLDDAIRLVHKRGGYMREAGRKRPGGMLSVIGLDGGALEDVIRGASGAGIIRAANLNCPGQVVLSGEMAALQAAERLAAERGAMKTVFLKVDGAFHSPLMQEAAERLAAELASVAIRRPSMPFVANVTGEFADDPEEIRRLLAAQVTSSVLWEKSMRTLLAAGAAKFVEIGPGRVLTGLMKRIDRRAPIDAVGDYGAAAALGAAA